jgi:hypothetical protein
LAKNEQERDLKEQNDHSFKTVACLQNAILAIIFISSFNSVSKVFNNMGKDPVIPNETIISKIYLIRGQKVMLDSDLALLYEVETKTFNQAVKRNSNRFPEDFMFRLTDEEFQNLRSQNVTSSWGGRRYTPNVFTEQGVAMLSSILNSDRAIAMNIQIIRVFTRLREMLLTNQDILLKLEQLDRKIINIGFDVKMHDGAIATIFELIKEMMAEKEKPPVPREQIGFKIKSNKNK